MNISLRTATDSDWQTLQELNNQVFQNDKDNDPDLDLNWPYTERGIGYYKKLADGTYGHCIIAEESGAVVGYVALAVKTFDYRKSKYVEVENIGVSPEHRSLGIGTALMKAAEQWAKSQGASSLYVEAFWENQRAINYYKENGFFELGVQLKKVAK
ncbi:GNAT family N-acetyltransferase [Candidatus Woesebacteria bacterium]|nr:GNAT family N-acetyltransferase [Candidatus Woesebacteria bacterium]